MAKLKRYGLKLLLALPPPVLRALCGGGVVFRGGRTLDPRLQFLASASKSRPALWRMRPEDARRTLAEEAALVGLSLDPAVSQETVNVEGPRGPIALTVLKPEKADPARPPLLYLHGGGGVMGSPAIVMGFASRLARILRTPVVLVDYRLAPEHKAPAALEDALAAYRWVAARLSPSGPPAVGGEASGGGLAASLCLALRAAGEPQPALQVLLYPWLDLTAEGGSMATYADAYPAPRALIDWAVGQALPADTAPTDVRLSPGREADLSGLARAIVVSAGFDPMLDQAEDYAKRLTAAGVPTLYRCYESLTHGFLIFAGAVQPAKAAALELCNLLRDELGSGPPEPPLRTL